MSEQVMMTFDEWWDAEMAKPAITRISCRDAWEAGYSAGQFALNNELGIAANEAAKQQRLETFMQEIERTDMVPLPKDRIRELAKKLQG